MGTQWSAEELAGLSGDDRRRYVAELPPEALWNEEDSTALLVGVQEVVVKTMTLGEFATTRLARDEGWVEYFARLCGWDTAEVRRLREVNRGGTARQCRRRIRRAHAEARGLTEMTVLRRGRSGRQRRVVGRLRGDAHVRTAPALASVVTRLRAGRCASRRGHRASRRSSASRGRRAGPCGLVADEEPHDHRRRIRRLLCARGDLR